MVPRSKRRDVKATRAGPGEPSGKPGGSTSSRDLDSSRLQVTNLSKSRENNVRYWLTIWPLLSVRLFQEVAKGKRNVASLPSVCDAALGRANFVAVNRHFKRTAHPPRASSRTRYMFSSAPGNGRPLKDHKSDGIEHHLRPIHVGGDASNDISLTMITNM